MTGILTRSKWLLASMLAVGMVFLAGSINHGPSGVFVGPGISQALAKAGCPDGDGECYRLDCESAVDPFDMDLCLAGPYAEECDWLLQKYLCDFGSCTAESVCKTTRDGCVNSQSDCHKDCKTAFNGPAQIECKQYCGVLYHCNEGFQYCMDMAPANTLDCVSSDLLGECVGGEVEGPGEAIVTVVTEAKIRIIFIRFDGLCDPSEMIRLTVGYQIGDEVIREASVSLLTDIAHIVVTDELTFHGLLANGQAVAISDYFATDEEMLKDELDALFQFASNTPCSLRVHLEYNDDPDGLMQCLGIVKNTDPVRGIIYTATPEVFTIAQDLSAIGGAVVSSLPDLVVQLIDDEPECGCFLKKEDGTCFSDVSELANIFLIELQAKDSPQDCFGEPVNGPCDKDNGKCVPWSQPPDIGDPDQLMCPEIDAPPVAGQAVCRCVPQRESWCEDGLDDEGDGLVDCDDPDCAGQEDCPGGCGDGMCGPGEDANNCQQDCCQEACGNGQCEPHCGEDSNSCQQDCCQEACGNGQCEPHCGEDSNSCQQDCCQEACGNWQCEPHCGEDSNSCPQDCCQEACGNGQCEPHCGEDANSCPPDCCQEACGNGQCEPHCGEDVNNCQQDCCQQACGNGQCEPHCGEDSNSCQFDCCQEACGNGQCEPHCGEDVNNCQQDCCQNSCGNQNCEPQCNEEQSCPQDCCAPVCGDQACESGCGEYPDTCPSDCLPNTCGNGWCEQGELPINCHDDCGYCGDGNCDPAHETPGQCPSDCS